MNALKWVGRMLGVIRHSEPLLESETQAPTPTIVTVVPDSVVSKLLAERLQRKQQDKEE